MTRPADVTTDIYGRRKVWRWHRLDPSKAEYGAEWGLRGPQGSTYLLRRSDLYADWSHQMIAVGQYSGLWNESDNRGMEYLASDLESIIKAHPGNLDIDRKISPRDFQTWIIESGS